MGKIQRNIVKRGERNVISRHFHRKDDNEAIATWKLDLDRILHLFDVRSVTSLRSLLTFRFQTELEINTDVTDPDVRHDAANTHTTASEVRQTLPDATNVVPDVHYGVSNTHAVVSNIDHNTLKNRGDTDSQNPRVGTSYTVPVTEQLLTAS